MHVTSRVLILGLIVPLFLVLLPTIVLAQGPQVIELTGTKDNRFRTPGQKGDPVFKLKAGEVITLRYTCFRGPEWEKDGTLHDFSVKEFKDQGWSVRCKAGSKDYTLVVPDKPGTYKAGCFNVKCGKGHDQMLATFIVEP